MPTNLQRATKGTHETSEISTLFGKNKESNVRVSNERRRFVLRVDVRPTDELGVSHHLLGGGYFGHADVLVPIGTNLV